MRDCSSLLLPPLAKKLKRLSCSSTHLVALSDKVERDTLIETHLSVRMDKNMRCIPIETLQKHSSLKSLTIDGADEVSGMRALKSLTNLKISNCKTLRCVPQGWLRPITVVGKYIFDYMSAKILNVWYKGKQSRYCLLLPTITTYRHNYKLYSSNFIPSKRVTGFILSKNNK